jgi:hypothetical protein
MAESSPDQPSERDPMVVLCQAAIEQAVMVAEAPPFSLGTAEAYATVSREMLRQAIVAAIESGLDADALARLASEAIVAASRVRGSA